MKIKLQYLALGLLALLGSFAVSSQRSSAYTATDRLSPSSAAAPGMLGADSTSLSGANPIPAALGTYTTYLPVVMKPAQGIFGNLTQGGAPVGGIALNLQFYNGSSYSPIATTTTNSSGYYLFTGVPALGAGQSYYVEYGNPENSSSRLSYWGSADVTSYTPGSTISLGTSDLANIPLTAPSPGVTVALPYLFEWGLRPATPSDSYFYVLFNLSTKAYASTNLLGYVGSVNIRSLPSGFNPGTAYGWYVAVMDSNGGIGSSFYYRQVTFSNTGASVSGPLNTAPQAAERRKSLPPPHLQEK